MKEQSLPTKEPQKVEYNTKQLLFLVMFGICGGLCLGYNSGIVAGGMIYLEGSFPEITVSEKSVSNISLIFSIYSLL